MTNTKKPKGTKITTPFGRAGFSCLQQPSTKFNADGEFNCKVILEDNAETAEFIARLDALYEAAYQTNFDAARAEKPKLTAIKRADKPYKRVTDPDTGEELPQWSVNARMKAVRRGAAVTGPDGKKSPGPILGQNSPIVLDSQNKPVYTSIGNGSILRFQAMAFPFFTAALGSGLQLKLIGVQVKELVPFTGGYTAEFDAVEGGFTETSPAPAVAPPQAARETPAAVDTDSVDNAEWV